MGLTRINVQLVLTIIFTVSTHKTTHTLQILFSFCFFFQFSLLFSTHELFSKIFHSTPDYFVSFPFHFCFEITQNQKPFKFDQSSSLIWFLFLFVSNFSFVLTPRFTQNFRYCFHFFAHTKNNILIIFGILIFHQ